MREGVHEGSEGDSAAGDRRQRAASAAAARGRAAGADALHHLPAANAVAVGNDLVCAAGVYDPHTHTHTRGILRGHRSGVVRSSTVPEKYDNEENETDYEKDEETD